jgi:hypothetical protein
MLLADREMSIGQEPSPFGQGFAKTTPPKADKAAAGAVVLLCRNLPAQQKMPHPLCLGVLSEAPQSGTSGWLIFFQSAAPQRTLRSRRMKSSSAVHRKKRPRKDLRVREHQGCTRMSG